MSWFFGIATVSSHTISLVFTTASYTFLYGQLYQILVSGAKINDQITPDELQESESADSSLSSPLSLSQEKYYNTNMNKQIFETRNKRWSSFGKSAEISTMNPPIVDLEGSSKRHSPIPSDDIYVQQEMALHQSLRGDQMASSDAGMKPNTVTVDTQVYTKQESGKSTKQCTETLPRISLSTAPAHITPRGKPYPLPPYPIPRYFIERHRNMKTDWEHPHESDLFFCFTRKLHEPTVQAHHTMLGPIDASNEIIKQCNDQNRKEKKRREGLRDLW